MKSEELKLEALEARKVADAAKLAGSEDQFDKEVLAREKEQKVRDYKEPVVKKQVVKTPYVQVPVVEKKKKKV